LNGRYIRCEPARVNRTIFLGQMPENTSKTVNSNHIDHKKFHKIHSIISLCSVVCLLFICLSDNIQEIQQLAESFGGIEDITIIKTTTMQSITAGAFIRYQYRDDAIKAYLVYTIHFSFSVG
jgi:RNA recognition motif. (a.k.a. RRM, RBD, or RNP domain)